MHLTRLVAVVLIALATTATADLPSGSTDTTTIPPSSNDFLCSRLTNCVSCVRELGHENFGSAKGGQNTCKWCVGGIYDGTCRFTCDQPIEDNNGHMNTEPSESIVRQIDRHTECPYRHCISHDTCEECLDDTNANVDCQWCEYAMTCGDFYEEPYSCSDPKGARVHNGLNDPKSLCPRTGTRYHLETALGAMGTMVLFCCLPCLFCRWCMLPWVACIDRCFWRWKKSFFKKDEFGEGAALDPDLDFVREVLKAEKENRAMRRGIESDGEDDD